MLPSHIRFDRRGFVIGSIAPDCIIENADWSDFTPPRAVTHFMTGEIKTTADHEGFYRRYIANAANASREESAFLWGYYAHLVTDAMFQAFQRDDERVAACFARLKRNPDAWARFAGLPETYDSVKAVFGRAGLERDIAYLESRYLDGNPDNAYDTVLRRTTDFPDYLDFLPPGAITRKIPLMAKDAHGAAPMALLLFSEEEYEAFVSAVCERLMRLILKKIG